MSGNSSRRWADCTTNSTPHSPQSAKHCGYRRATPRSDHDARVELSLAPGSMPERWRRFPDPGTTAPEQCASLPGYGKQAVDEVTRDVTAELRRALQPGQAPRGRRHWAALCSGA